MLGFSAQDEQKDLKIGPLKLERIKKKKNHYQLVPKTSRCTPGDNSAATFTADQASRRLCCSAASRRVGFTPTAELQVSTRRSLLCFQESRAGSSSSSSRGCVGVVVVAVGGGGAGGGISSGNNRHISP